MIPSRHSNPFSTCWTKPGALEFRFAEGGNAEQLVERLRSQGWRGEIVGPHGSGKSTLLVALRPALALAGRSVCDVVLHAGERRLPRGFLTQALSLPSALVIVDGYEQLGRLSRMWLKRSCRRAGAGLVVTTHAPSGLPTLARLSPDLSLVQRLVATLSQRAATPVTPGDVAACFACHGSNVREIFFDLYDRHEHGRRSARTAGCCRA